jgi:hypothetical protein
MELGIMAMHLLVYCFFFLDEGGPRRSTRADYETAIAATGNNCQS